MKISGVLFLVPSSPSHYPTYFSYLGLPELSSLSSHLNKTFWHCDENCPQGKLGSSLCSLRLLPFAERSQSRADCCLVVSYFPLLPPLLFLVVSVRGRGIPEQQTDSLDLITRFFVTVPDVLKT